MPTLFLLIHCFTFLAARRIRLSVLLDHSHEPIDDALLLLGVTQGVAEYASQFLCLIHSLEFYRISIDKVA